MLSYSRILLVVVLLGSALLPFGVEGQQPSRFTVGSWNLESGDSEIAQLTRYLTRSPEARAAGVWGFSEVAPYWDDRLVGALRTHGRFELILGDTGNNDRLAIAYDAAQFEMLSWGEIDHINTTGYARAPLWAQLRHRATGKTFVFMVNHLYRTRDEERHAQARLLNRWAAEVELPIIAVGDYNFDWDVARGASRHDRGYDLMVEGGVFRWVRPRQMRRSQCGNRSRLILDFVFVAGAARSWRPTSRIAGSDPAFCPGDRDNDVSSDHRPIFGAFTPPT